jgi:hypothetical protein
MNKRTHIILGRLLYQRLTEDFGICLDKQSFLLGNILPDLTLSFIVRPHFIDSSIQHIRDEIKRLIPAHNDSVYCGSDFSRRLGEICHYCADFFCFPHSIYYKGDIPSHVRYEKALYHYLKDNIIESTWKASTVKRSGKIDGDEVVDRIYEAQNEYHQAVPSFDTDVTFSLQACLHVILMITKVPVNDTMQMTEEFNPPPLFI